MAPIVGSESRTKIVCTLGPVSRDAETLRGMLRAGMDVARINFSHGTHAEHAATIETVRRVADSEGATVAVLGDLQGPKLRVGEVGAAPIPLREGDHLTLTAEADCASDGALHVPHPEVIAAAEPGDVILLADGAMELTVEERVATDLVCVVVVGGQLRSHAGLALIRRRSGDGERLGRRFPALTPKDREDARFALDQGIDYLALSFVRTAADIAALRDLAASDKPGVEIGIMVKIEKREAIERIDEILACVDAVMIARGDLGVEVSAEEVPVHQKAIIRKCNRLGIPVITATQMLESMIDHPRPTRAEVSDVANAIIDGTDAVMLSAETAIGRYPIEAVRTMARIASTAESRMPPQGDDTGFADVSHRHPITDAISDATARVAGDLGARLIVTSTWSGYTARQVAKERPEVPIVAITPNETTRRRLALSWGVTPLCVPEEQGTDAMLEEAACAVLAHGLAERGDLIVLTGGIPLGGGRTNFLKVHRLECAEGRGDRGREAN